LTIAVTGPDGFLAWHVRCALRAMTGQDAVLLGHAALSNPEHVAVALSGVDSVIHLAGVNRGVSDSEIFSGNVDLATVLVEGISKTQRPVNVVFANSIHMKGNSTFGQAKARAAEILREAEGARIGSLADVILPNLFGESGRPHYNSFVATFCDALARGGRPEVVEDREINLLHAQGAAELLVSRAMTGESGVDEPAGEATTVGTVLKLLDDMAIRYRTGQYPDLSEPLVQDLFNTYRSYTFPEHFPMYPDAMTDPRGRLVESVRANGGETQVFFSTTRPGMTRGEHFHLRKVERFLVIGGLGEIRLRRMFGAHVVTFRVSGERPAIVDMPTMWAHSITNVGEGDLTTLFYANQCFNPQAPDTYPEKVVSS
jgi:UDP-2-acetamido-2,6-beta-L-arabino-hexul-4-ose reductase